MLTRIESKMESLISTADVKLAPGPKTPPSGPELNLPVSTAGPGTKK